MATTTTPNLIAYWSTASLVSAMLFDASVPSTVLKDIWVGLENVGIKAIAVGDGGARLELGGSYWYPMTDIGADPTIDLKSIREDTTTTTLTLYIAGYSLVGPYNTPSPVVLRLINNPIGLWEWEDLGFTAATSEAVSAVAPFGGEVWAGSGDWGTAPPCEGGLFTWSEGGAWTPSPIGEKARRLWAGAESVHGVFWCNDGTQSALKRFKDASTLADSAVVDGKITAIWGVDGCELYAVGLGGVIYER
jgi:hypothetical protein